MGGDGVVPMAAVPDLAEYSNESTFALSVLDSNGAGTPVAGAQASGFFLSDDPYATDAGISILNGDHELYVPDRNVGRVVETPDEIVAQLENFVTYGRQGRPTHVRCGRHRLRLPQRRSRGCDRRTRRRVRGRFVARRRMGSRGLPGSLRERHGLQRVLPERSLRLRSAAARDLPDAEGVYDENDLVDTSDFVAGFAHGSPGSAAGTRLHDGCHAGLSVSDVQLGRVARLGADVRRPTTSGSLTPPTATATPRSSPTPSVWRSCSPARSANICSVAGAPTSLGDAMVRAKQEYLATHLHDHAVRREDPAVVDLLRPADVLDRRAPAHPRTPRRPSMHQSMKPIVEETAVEEPLAQPQGSPCSPRRRAGAGDLRRRARRKRSPLRLMKSTSAPNWRIRRSPTPQLVLPYYLDRRRRDQRPGPAGATARRRGDPGLGVRSSTPGS